MERQMAIHLINKTRSATKHGPGRVHAQGDSRKRSVGKKMPGTHRELRDKKREAV
jgi:hypothetical protein